MIALSRREQRKLETQEKHKKQCKGCGVAFSARDRTFCSDECRRKDVDNKLVYSCAQCGKSVRKRTVSTAKFQFCDKQCQDAFQGSGGYYRSRIVYSWMDRSKVAKRKYKSESSKRRKMQSESFQWWRLCKAEMRRTKHQKKDEWDSRCSNALSALKARFEPVFKLKSQKAWSWDSRVAYSRKNLHGNKKQQSEEDLEWEKKCRNALKMSKLRVQRSGALNIGKLG